MNAVRLQRGSHFTGHIGVLTDDIRCPCWIDVEVVELLFGRILPDLLLTFVLLGRCRRRLVFWHRSLKTMAYYFSHANCPFQPICDIFSDSFRAKLLCAETFWRHNVTRRSRRSSVRGKGDLAPYVVDTSNSFFTIYQ